MAFIEEITGSLDDEQVALVTHHRARMPDDTEEWLRYTEGRYQVLLAHLEAGADRERLTRLLERSFVNFADMPDRLHRNHSQRLDVVVELIVELSASLSLEQREHTVTFLRALRDDARLLAGET